MRRVKKQACCGSTGEPLSRLAAAHSARRYERQAGCVGAPERAPVAQENVQRSLFVRRCPRPRLGIQADGNKPGAENVSQLGLYSSFEAKHNCSVTQLQCTMDSLARFCLEASERRRSAARGRRFRQQDKTLVLPAHLHSGLHSPWKNG